jgi:hypothetical protein
LLQPVVAVCRVAVSGPSFLILIVIFIASVSGPMLGEM